MNAVDTMAGDSDHLADRLILSLRCIAAAQGPRACLCVLIDPLLGDPLVELASAPRLPICSLRIAHDDLAAEDSPYLLKVGKEQDHERLISTTLRIAMSERRAAQLESPASCSICAWLFVDEDDLPRLVAALSRFALLARPGRDGTRSLFRFWDPRVFQHLPRIFGQAQLESALPDPLALQWVWLAPSGQLTSCSFSNGQGRQPSLAQWQALSRVEDLNQCLVLSETQQTQDSIDHIVDLDGALQRADTLGCRDSIDRITYALLAMSLGGSFENHPSMNDLFRQVTQDRASFAALAEAVEQSVWDRVKNDMASERQHQKSGGALQ